LSGSISLQTNLINVSIAN